MGRIFCMLLEKMTSTNSTNSTKMIDQKEFGLYQRYFLCQFIFSTMHMPLYGPVLFQQKDKKKNVHIKKELMQLFFCNVIVHYY
jgi:hypothetical protein